MSNLLPLCTIIYTVHLPKHHIAPHFARLHSERTDIAPQRVLIFGRLISGWSLDSSKGPVSARLPLDSL